MNKQLAKYWENKLNRYSKQDWINKPSIFAKQVIKYFPQTGKILDIGAGQGQDSLYFAGKNYKVTAIDLSNFGLSSLQEKANKNNLNIKIKQIDLSSNNLPFKDNSFEIVYSHMSLHYFNTQRTKEIFIDINRILKKGGLFVSLFNNEDDPEKNTSSYLKLEENFYQTKEGLQKRYFDLKFLEKITKSFFNPVVMDKKGETYKDEINSLIRFIGRKIK